MLRWAFIFLVLALVSAFFGFGGVAAVSADIARILFFVFLALFLIAVAGQVFRGKPPPV